eukprot:4429393-Pyramimonas_sp.AAC.1
MVNLRSLGPLRIWRGAPLRGPGGAPRPRAGHGGRWARGAWSCSRGSRGSSSSGRTRRRPSLRHRSPLRTQSRF